MFQFLKTNTVFLFCFCHVLVSLNEKFGMDANEKSGSGGSGSSGSSGYSNPNQPVQYNLVTGAPTAAIGTGHHQHNQDSNLSTGSSDREMRDTNEERTPERGSGNSGGGGGSGQRNSSVNASTLGGGSAAAAPTTPTERKRRRKNTDDVAPSGNHHQLTPCTLVTSGSV